LAKRIEKSIVKKIQSGQFALTVHARKRMSDRFISEQDIVEVAKTLKSIEHQNRNDTFLLVGNDTWGKGLMVAAAMRNEVIIVTVFFEE